jgi:hypothetical protein
VPIASSTIVRVTRSGQPANVQGITEQERAPLFGNRGSWHALFGLDMASPGILSRRHFVGVALGGLGLQARILRAETSQTLNMRTVCDRVQAMDDWRTNTLLSYSATRRYRLRIGASAESAEMLVKVEYTYPGHKHFELLSETNCGFIQKHALLRLMEEESETASPGVHDNIRINPRNYDFVLQETTQLGGRPTYVIRIRPTRKQRLLVDGQIWVDAEDAAVARMDGYLSIGSFWVRQSHILQSYQKIGPYWLIASNRNDARARALGEVHLNVDCFDYHIIDADSSTYSSSTY